MLNLLTAYQLRQADEHTVATGTVSFYELMEQAGQAFTRAFVSRFPNKDREISVYCGTGNNGGDGLVVARLLHHLGYRRLNVKAVRFNSKVTDDFEANHTKIIELGIALYEVEEISDLPEETADLIIDALLGTGLNKPLEGDWHQLIEFLNTLEAEKVALDIPTGLPSEGPVEKALTAFHAHHVITFQRPKINFLLPESARALEQFEVVDIGLDEEFIQSVSSPYCMLMEEDIRKRIHPRKRFSHKGTYGNALIIAGSAETMGAALLCCEGCLNAGAGLTTACIPQEGLLALNARRPEVIAALRHDSLPVELEWEKFKSIAVGPGLGLSSGSKALLTTAMRQFKRPMVIDADAINIIAENYEVMGLVPEGSVFTPHVKEFDRLFGNHQNWWARLETGMERATHLGCTIVLKNQYTIIFTPQGRCIFNPTGTPAMATGGSGDVLTGVIASFLAQGYLPVDAAILGVYLHGKAGRLLAEDEGHWVVPAGLLPGKVNKLLSQLSS